MIAESFRNIRSNIEFILPKHEDGKVILFTSSISGEGKHFVLKIWVARMLFQVKKLF